MGFDGKDKLLWRAAVRVCSRAERGVVPRIERALSFISDRMEYREYHRSRLRAILVRLQRTGSDPRKDRNWSYHIRNAAGAEGDDRRMRGSLRAQETASRILLPEVFMGLRSVARDFASWTYRGGVLALTTQPITLEDVELGPFSIVLVLRNYPGWSVRADVPHTSSRGYNHPHLNGDQLCTGEGRASIAAALERCDLQSFFLMVKAVLETYNGEGAYCQLSSWGGGGSCDSCGESFSSENLYRCACCGQVLCEGCSYCCERCDTTRCHLHTCGVCGESLCDSCTRECECGITTCLDDSFPCPRCGGRVCAECVVESTDGRELCANCVELMEERSEAARGEAESVEEKGEGPAAEEAGRRTESDTRMSPLVAVRGTLRGCECPSCQILRREAAANAEAIQS